MKWVKIVEASHIPVLERPPVFTHFNISSQRESLITAFPLDFVSLRWLNYGWCPVSEKNTSQFHTGLGAYSLTKAPDGKPETWIDPQWKDLCYSLWKKSNTVAERFFTSALFFVLKSSKTLGIHKVLRVSNQQCSLKGKYENGAFSHRKQFGEVFSILPVPF